LSLLFAKKEFQNISKEWEKHKHIFGPLQNNFPAILGAPTTHFTSAFI
jgi:hypothetical protein